MTRTAKQIVDQTNKIAKIIAESQGWVVSEGFDFHRFESRAKIMSRQENCWDAACKIQELLTETDVTCALDELEEE